MENGSIFWNKISGLFGSIGLPYISKTEAVLILLAALLILCFLLWLIFRGIRLWYWKTNVQIDTLKSIDSHLKIVEERLSSDTIKVVGIPDQVSRLQNNNTDLSEQEPQEETETVTEGLTAIGKSGRVYTEAELEMLIRD